MYQVLKRISQNRIQTVGKLYTYDEEGSLLLTLDTLELTWKNNERRVSCIPRGKYIVKPNISARFGQGFKVENVVNRSGILFHAGNLNSQTKGCILVGLGYSYLNNDMDLDLKNSKLAMSLFKEVVRENYELEITELW